MSEWEYKKIALSELPRGRESALRDVPIISSGRWPSMRSTAGYASDRIPGAKGVGPKTAAGLLIKYRSLENLLAAGRFVGQAGALRLYRSIATMDRKAPLPSLKDQVPTWAKAASLARQWELTTLMCSTLPATTGGSWSRSLQITWRT